MIIQEPKKILERRFEIEKQLVNKYGASVMDLAEYFSTTPSVIRSDLRANGIEPGNSCFTIIEKSRCERDAEIQKFIDNGVEKYAILTEYGLWRMPKSLVQTSFISDVTLMMPCSDEIKGRLLSLIELGWSAEDAFKRMKTIGLEVDSTSKIILKSYLKANNLSPKHVKELDVEMVEMASNTLKIAYQDVKKKILSYGRFRKNVFKDILALTGVSEIKMYEAIEKNSYANKRVEILNVRKNDRKIKNVKLIDKNALKISAYEEWISGSGTQEEIASRYSVSRITLITWFNEVKSFYLKDLDLENIPLKCKRNLKSGKSEKYNDDELKYIIQCSKIKQEKSSLNGRKKLK